VDPDWPGYLVGQEHFAHDADKATEAYAWARELELRNDPNLPERQRGIWARLHKTPLGEQTIGSVYKYLSAVTDLQAISGNRMRPVSIDDIGLTNKPAYKTLVPAMHRDRPPEENSTMLDTLRKLLAKHRISLADDVGEDAALQAVDTALAGIADVAALKTRAETAEHRVAELEQAEVERKADEFVAKHKAKVSDEAKLRKLYIEHREAAEGMIEIVNEPDSGDKTLTLHRQDGKTPDGSPAGETPEQARHRAQEQEDYVAQVQKDMSLKTRAEARALAEVRKPELFA